MWPHILIFFSAILEKYNLQEDFKALQDAAIVSKPSKPEMSNDAYVKSVFRDKKLNKLWLKAEQQGFSGNCIIFHLSIYSIIFHVFWTCLNQNIKDYI